MNDVFISKYFLNQFKELLSIDDSRVFGVYFEIIDNPYEYDEPFSESQTKLEDIFKYQLKEHDSTTEYPIILQLTNEEVFLLSLTQPYIETIDSWYGSETDSYNLLQLSDNFYCLAGEGSMFSTIKSHLESI